MLSKIIYTIHMSLRLTPKSILVFNFHYYSNLFSGYGEGNQKGSGWCHCSGQGNDMNWEHTVFQVQLHLHQINWMWFSYIVRSCHHSYPFFIFFQEDPLPDPSELFSHVYVKGLGTEVNELRLISPILHSLLKCFISNIHEMLWDYVKAKTLFLWKILT